MNINNRNTYVEVGQGVNRQRGYGDGYDFLPGDIYIGIDLPYAEGSEANRQNLPSSVNSRVPIYLSSLAINKARSDGKHVPDTAVAGLQDIDQFVESRGMSFLSIAARGEQLPLADNSVSEVLFSNVISDPSVSTLTKVQLLNEALRVIDSEQGRVVVNDLYTPYLGLSALSFFIKHSKKIAAEEINFLASTYTHSDQEWGELSRQYRRLGINTEYTHVLTPLQTESETAQSSVARYSAANSV